MAINPKSTLIKDLKELIAKPENLQWNYKGCSDSERLQLQEVNALLRQALNTALKQPDLLESEIENNCKFREIERNCYKFVRAYAQKLDIKTIDACKKLITDNNLTDVIGRYIWDNNK